MAKKVATETETESETDAAPEAPQAPQVGFPKKMLYWIGGITAVVWAFAISTGSMVFMIVIGVLTVLLAAVLLRAFLFIRKQKSVVGLLQGAAQSPEKRKEALEKLEGGKDADSPTNLSWLINHYTQQGEDPADKAAKADPIAPVQFNQFQISGDFTRSRA